jgi:hypothetical protein
MHADFLRQAIKQEGGVLLRHHGGSLYYVDHIGKMQVNGEWVEAIMYHALLPFGWYCRAIDDFEKFEYVSPNSLVR